MLIAYNNSLQARGLFTEAPLLYPEKKCTSCMQCDTEFSLIMRKRHCRACGKVMIGTQVPFTFDKSMNLNNIQNYDSDRGSAGMSQDL